MVDVLKEFREVAERIRILVLGGQGKALDEDLFSGMLDVKDHKQTGIESEADTFVHSAMYALADMHPSELGFLKEWAKTEDSYSNSVDGQGKKVAVLMAVGKKEAQTPSPVTVQLPEVRTTPQEPPKPEKKGFLRR